MDVAADGHVLVAWGVAGATIGALIVWSLLRPRRLQAVTLLAQRDDEIARLGHELQVAGERIETFRGEANDLRIRKAELATALEVEGRAAAEKLAAMQDAEQRLREAFDALSAQALARNNQSFLDLARTQLGAFQQHAQAELDARQQAVSGLVTPLRESVAAVQTKLTEIEKERVGAYASLETQLKSLLTVEQALRAETANLSRALRSPSARGRWGEIQLQRVIELAGMVQHCDYVAQQTVYGDDGRLRPDVVVRLPGGKQLVIDAKAPLSAYLEALEATDELVREAKLRDHARHVRDHMKRLGAKAYQDQFSTALEFVVMFLPGETFFGAALQADPTLIEFGVDQRVIPASPTTLIALLRAVAYGWRHEALADNARAICDQGAALYDRLATMSGHFARLGGALRKTIEAHDAFAGTLERRVLPTARRLRELGASTEAELPELATLDLQPRALQAAELVAVAAGPAEPADDPAATLLEPLRIVRS